MNKDEKIFEKYAAVSLQIKQIRNLIEVLKIIDILKSDVFIAIPCPVTLSL